MHRRRAAGTIVAVVAATLSASMGCGDAKSSGVTASGGLEVVLVSDMSIPRDIDRVRLDVTQRGKSVLHVERDVGEGALLIPASFEVKGTGDATPVTIQGVAYKDGEPRVERRAITPIPADRVGILRLALNYLCVGTAQQDAHGKVTSTCPDGTTCVQGSCVTPKVPESSVPTYTPGDAGVPAGADGGTSGGCFDVQQCFSSATPANVDYSSCALTLPPGLDPSRVNLALQYPAGAGGVCGPSACWVVFEQGSDWTVKDGRIALPSGTCTSVASSRGTWVLTTACLPKTPSTPACGSWSSISTPVAEPPTTTGPAPSCQGPSTQPCGLCGTQTRGCVNGIWSAWSACADEGTCAAGTTEKCGANGVRTCSASCQLGACECASGELSCGTNGDCATPDDPATCGTCSHDCSKLTNVVTRGLGCSRGTCSYGCAQGFADCDKAGDGCTTDLTDPATCGACDNDCTALAHVSGPTQCKAGNCVVPPTSCARGFADCNGDPSDGCETDITGPDHCGSCDVACSDAPLCAPSGKSWACASSCPPSTTACGQKCVDTTSDQGNCGDCDNACAADRTCVAGKCTGVCGPDQLSCNGQQPRTCDAAGQWQPNGSACSANQTCVAGKCTGVCGPNQTGTQPCGNCNSGKQTRTCNADGTWSAFSGCSGAVDLTTDPANCGACGNACANGSTCQAGKCVCPGSATQPCGNCNTGTQTRTCSPTGVWGPFSTTCVGGGACVPGTSQSCGANAVSKCSNTCAWSPCNCSSGFTSCGTTCVNTQTDNANCGACGNACVSGSTCQAGKCVCPGSATQSCGNCNTGTQTRTCGPTGVWSAFTTCSGGGVCAPGATQTQGCVANATSTCSMSCAWGPCTCNGGRSLCSNICVDTQSDNSNCGTCGNACTSGVTCQGGTCPCSGPASQSCGNCGGQSRTCNPNGTWGSFGACGGEGPCTPGQTQSCPSSGGFQTCGSNCQWSRCPTIFKPSTNGQTFVVPSGVRTLYITATGGDGGSSYSGTGGRGAMVSFMLAVTPGASLQIYPGGSGSNNRNPGKNGFAYVGGWGGGDAMGSFPQVGSGGGAASVVRMGSNDIVIAGGGGGGGGSQACSCAAGSGGNGGTPDASGGGAGDPGCGCAAGGGFGGGGGGATQSVDGFGGSGIDAIGMGLGGDQGGMGGGVDSGSLGGGGGGGGYFTGGGGGAGWAASVWGGGGGGGGGSSWVISSATAVTFQLSTSSLVSGTVAISW